MISMKNIKKNFLLFALFVALAPNHSYAVCSSPAGIAGEMGYSLTGGGEMEYCNDTSWTSMNAAGSDVTPTGYWKLDETTGASIADDVGSSTGTWTDAVNNSVAEETTAGKIGTAITFD